jgi:hypothetical protein
VRRALVFAGAIALLVGLAFIVARPSVPDVATNPYEGVRGASRAKATGIAISVRRGDEVLAVEPGVTVRAGDRMVFRMRGEKARYLELRVRDGNGPEVTLAPIMGDMAAPISPGTWLQPIDLTNAPGRVQVSAVFSDQPRRVGTPPDADTEEMNVSIAKE